VCRSGGSRDSHPPPPHTPPPPRTGTPQTTERTVALLAFDDPHSSPVGELMEPSQRQKTASELNAAILSSQCHETEPRVALLLKMMLWAQQRLDERAHYPRIVDLVAAQPGGAAAGAGAGAKRD